MAQEYLDLLTAFINQKTLECLNGVQYECKHFFSGAALYVDGRITLTLTPVGLALKLPDVTKDELFAKKSAVPLRYFPNAPIKKDYVLFPKGIDTNTRTLRKYITESVEYVLS